MADRHALGAYATQRVDLRGDARCDGLLHVRGDGGRVHAHLGDLQLSCGHAFAVHDVSDDAQHVLGVPRNGLHRLARIGRPIAERAVLDDPWILLYEKKIASMADLLPLLEQIAKNGRPLVVVADDIEGDALATLVVNRVRGTLPCVAVKAPGFGDRRRAMLEDLAVLTGGRLIAEELGIKLANVTLEDLGQCKRVVADKDSTTIVGGAGTKADIDGRAAEIRAQIKSVTSEYDREKLEERLAKLTGGVAVLKVGAPSEAELKNRREAFDDAIAATKAAMSEGVVPGAGLALLRAIDDVEREAQACGGDERTGVLILRRALEAPTRQIAENSGVDGGVVVDRMRSGSENFGFDAGKGAYVDLVGAGIIDPTKVTRLALQNATSVSGLLLTTEAMIAEAPKAEAPAPAGGHSHGILNNLPHAIATEIAFAFRFTAERMYEVGYLNRLVDADQLMPEARKMADHLLSLPPASRVNTLYMTRALRGRVPDDIEAYAKLLHNHGAQSDRVESRKAFAEKRKPNWVGK